MNQFRQLAPVRTFTRPYTNYLRYKKPLSKDFNCRCGYTDVHHIWFGGIRNFQIDHFKPHSIALYSHLKHEYSNLVYTCSLVNRAKWDDDSPYYLDPCNDDLNLHFYRDQNGNICVREGSVHGQYMYKKMKLYLRCYGTIWTLEQIQNRLDKMSEIRLALPEPQRAELSSMIADLYTEFRYHTTLLSKFHDGDE
jgi:hypothetical protein